MMQEPNKDQAAAEPTTAEIEQRGIGACAVPIFEPTTTKSWPLHSPEQVPGVEHEPLAGAMTMQFDYDAHFACYFSPERFARLSKHGPDKSDDDYRERDDRDDTRGAHERLERGVIMLATAFDFDCADVHGTKEPAPDNWRDAQLAPLRALAARHPGGFAYWTRGGGRVVFRRQPFHIRTAADDRAWTQLYVRTVCYLAREFDLVCDPSCRDWTRVFRLPHVVRDGQLQDYGRIKL